MSFKVLSLRSRAVGHVLPAGSICAFGLALAGASLIPRDASAQRYYVVYDERREPWARFNLGFDGEGAVPLSVPGSPSGNTLSGGGGFKIRVGEQFRFYNVRVIPEVGYGYDHLFATDDFGDAFAWDMHRIFAGARIGFGRIVVPGFYAHVGYGWRDTDDPFVRDDQGVAFDAGAMLDIHVIPHFGFGAHAEYALIDAQPVTPHWLAIGLHGDIVF